MIIKTQCQIKNCNICNNKAKHSGGGIYADGKLFLENAKIFLNSCDVRGGGIFYSNQKKFLYDKNKIGSMVYDNSAGTSGKNFYPGIK